MAESINCPDPKRSGWLKMKDLVRATGTPKSTILHYLRQGLLPPPSRTSRNMAYYDPACVERIAFIKTMQRKHRLPLAEIWELLAGLKNSGEIASFMELNAAIFGRQIDKELVDQGEFCRATGLTQGEISSLVTSKLLMPLQPDLFDKEDIIIGRTLKRALQQGLAPQHLDFYRRLAEKIVDEEVAMRRRLTGHLPVEQDVALSREMVSWARALRIYIIDRTFQQRVLSMKSLKDQKP